MTDAPLLDTHIWVWWVVGDERLSPQLVERLDGFPEANRPVISAISLWEVAMLMGLGRLNLKMPIDQWFRHAGNAATIQTWPITTQIAAEVAALPDTFHRDPADRLIVATSRQRNVPLLTMDRRIVESGLARLWKA